MNIQSMQNDKLVPAELPEICAPRSQLLGALDKAAARLRYGRDLTKICGIF